jgi:hypothetical protein
MKRVPLAVVSGLNTRNANKTAVAEMNGEIKRLDETVLIPWVKKVTEGEDSRTVRVDTLTGITQVTLVQKSTTEYDMAALEKAVGPEIWAVINPEIKTVRRVFSEDTLNTLVKTGAVNRDAVAAALVVTPGAEYLTVTQNAK